MKHATGIALFTLFTGLTLHAFAGSAPISMSEDTFLVQRKMPWVSVGGGIELLERQLQLAGGAPGRVRAENVLGYLGVDLRHWFTVFGTLGQLNMQSVDIPGAVGDFKDDRRWSFGFNANVWHIDIEEPEIMAGRLTIGLVGEYTRYDASETGESLEWTEYALAVPIGYMLYVEPRKIQTVHGAVFFAGPIYSTLDGDYSAGGSRTDFDEEQPLGVLAGVDVFLAKNLTLGGHIQYFEEPSANFSLRYHF